jgi:hypothetical protein
MGFLQRLFGGRKTPAPAAPDLDGSRGAVIQAFHAIIAGPLDFDQLPDTDFAMWFPCTEDPAFVASPFQYRITEVFAAQSSHLSWIAGDFLKTLKVIRSEGTTARVELPEDTQYFAFETAQQEPVILTLSGEKGLRLHFAGTTAFGYRLQFLEAFLQYCTAWKALLELLNVPADPPAEFPGWWELTREMSLEMERHEPLLFVGKIAL